MRAASAVPRRRVFVPAFPGACEPILKLHQRDDLGDGLRLHSARGHFVLRLIDRRLRRGNARAGDADRNARSFARTAASGMIQPAWLTPSSPIRVASISLAGLQVVERRHHVAGEHFERGGLPVAGGPADAALVVAEHRHAAADQESGERQDELPVLRCPSRGPE